jgi:hypothetical protein
MTTTGRWKQRDVQNMGCQLCGAGPETPCRSMTTWESYTTGVTHRQPETVSDTATAELTQVVAEENTFVTGQDYLMLPFDRSVS